MSDLDWIIVTVVWCLPVVLVLIRRIRDRAQLRDEDDYR